MQSNIPENESIPDMLRRAATRVESSFPQPDRCIVILFNRETGLTSYMCDPEVRTREGIAMLQIAVHDFCVQERKPEDEDEEDDEG